MVIKSYKRIGKGSNLWEAIFEKNDSNNPPIVDKWIEEQSESYMDADWDHERIRILIWDGEDQLLIHFLTSIKVNIELDEFNRTIFEQWMKLANRQIRKSITKLKESFDSDLEGKREEWAYERANEDFSMFIGDFDHDKDEEVANFFGIKIEIEGIVIGGEEYDMSKVEFCKRCGEANVIEEMKEHFEVDVGAFNEGNYYCCECEEYYPYDEEHCRINKHIPPHQIIARRV